MASEDGASQELKEQQRAVLKHVYDGKDVFVWLPTGYVSPLLSLMIEQVQRLRECGVSSAILGLDVSSTRVPRELLAREHNIMSGTYKMLYSAPEAIIGVQFWRDILLRPYLRNAVAAIAIDESHCVSKWSKNFQPTYRRVLELRALVLRGVPMLALSATVTDLIRKDVITTLDMEGCEIVCHSPNCPNIY